MSADQTHINAHKHCFGNREELMNSANCGCFYCVSIFPPGEIVKWVDDEDQTALCPFCGIDSVIGSASGYPITTDFLSRMRKHWFGSRLADFAAIPTVIGVSFAIIWLFWRLIGHALDRIAKGG
jgi:hypothetical protein